MKLTPEFLIRVNYKSGIQEEFWVREFTIKPDGSLSWWCAGSHPVPISISNSNIESVWQVKVRYRFRPTGGE